MQQDLHGTSNGFTVTNPLHSPALSENNDGSPSPSSKNTALTASSTPPPSAEPDNLDLSKVQVPFPTNQERLVWGGFITAYFALVSLPAFFSATSYATLAVQEELPADNMGTTILGYFVKIAAVVPMIFGTNSFYVEAAKLAKFGQEESFPGVLKKLPHNLAIMSGPAIVAIVSSWCTAYMADSKLEKSETELPEWVIQWCYTAAMISASVTNSRLMRELLVNPVVSYFKGLGRQQSPDQKILEAMLKDCVSNLHKIEHAILYAPQADHDDENPSVSPYQTLAAQYVLLRDAPDVQSLSYESVKFWRDNFSQGKEKLLVSKAENVWFQTVLAVVFLSAAIVYTLPNLFAGFKAEDFARSLITPISSALADHLYGWQISAASYGANVPINFFGLWTLSAAVQRAYQAWQEGVLRPSGVLDKVEWFLMLMYVVTQIGMVVAFPADIPGLDPKAVSISQLILTAFVAAGLGKLSLESAFAKVKNYANAYQTKDLLANGTVAEIQEEANPCIPTLAMLKHIETKLNLLVNYVNSLPAEVVSRVCDEVNEKFEMAPDEPSMAIVPGLARHSSGDVTRSPSPEDVGDFSSASDLAEDLLSPQDREVAAPASHGQNPLTSFRALYKEPAPRESICTAISTWLRQKWSGNAYQKMPVHPV